jgi:phosphate transport system substrate-binding protein
MRVTHRIILISILAFISSGSLTVCHSQDAAKEVIRIKGSDSMADMVDLLARQFMQSHPNCNIIVSGGASPNASLESLYKKEAEVVMQTNDLEASENEAAAQKGVKLNAAIVGWGGIAIIANPSNPVNELTAQQVRKLFTGEIPNWKQVGGFDAPVSLFAVGESRIGSLEFFTKGFLKAPMASNVVTKAFFRSVIPAVAESKNATGFVRIRNLVQLKEQEQEAIIKIIAVKKDENSPAIIPTRETVNDGTYPITRPFILLADANSTGKLTRSFIDFCASKNPRKN